MQRVKGILESCKVREQKKKSIIMIQGKKSLRRKPVNIDYYGTLIFYEYEACYTNFQVYIKCRPIPYVHVQMHFERK